MKIKKNDTITVITGKDKGKSGKVLRAYPERSVVVVEGVHVVAKHVRPQKGGEKGQKVYFPRPIATSKVMILCPKCGQATRVGYRKIQDQETLSIKSKKERICKKCNQSLNA